MANVDVGTGTTVAFGTSTTFDAHVTGLSINGEEMAVIDISHMGTTGTRAKMLGDLKENVTVDVDMHYDPSETIPTGVGQTITITFPIYSGQTNGATLAGTGVIVSHSGSIPLEDKMTGSYKIQFTGAVTRVAGS
jgi:hypothetical protein